MRSKAIWGVTILCVIVCLICLTIPVVIPQTIAKIPVFDKNKAFGVLKKQCEFGPRPVGTPAHELTKTYLVNTMKQYSESVHLQEFTCDVNGKTLKFTNIIGRFGDAGTPSILLCAHWDTRPIADMDKDSANRNKPIMGANDGASGVAVLMELARLFKQMPPKEPVTIALFDGEDYGPGVDDMFFGSRYFAAHLDKKDSYRYGILIDMIGDANLNIYREWNSETRARSVNDIVWSAAQKLGYQKYLIDSPKYNINDDHLPLIDAGIPCVDVIDFDYPYWHTLADTVDKCRPDSLKIIGDTILGIVYLQ